MQTYTYLTDYGGGVVVAPCDATFLAEVARCNALGLLPGLTNLGQRGDPRHAREGTSSDHNAFVQGPSGLWYIRAHDFGGPKSTRQKLNGFWNWRYRMRDPRVYPYGYTNSADPAPFGLTIWFGDGSTRHGTDGDHEHESVNRANTTTIGRSAWTPALDSRAPWFLYEYLTGQAGGTPIHVQEDDDMIDPAEFAALRRDVTVLTQMVGAIATFARPAMMYQVKGDNRIYCFGDGMEWWMPAGQPQNFQRYQLAGNVIELGGFNELADVRAFFNGGNLPQHPDEKAAGKPAPRGMHAIA